MKAENAKPNLKKKRPRNLNDRIESRLLIDHTRYRTYTRSLNLNDRIERGVAGSTGVFAFD